MKQKYFVLGFFLALLFIIVYAGVTNFGRLEVSEDPGLTLSNGETISNSVDGTIDFGAANLTTTGTMTAGIDANIAITMGTDTLSLATATKGINHITVTALGAADTVTTITGLTARALYYFKIATGDSTLLFIDGSNIKSGGNVLLDATTDRVVFTSDGTNLVQVSAVSNND